MSHVKNNIIQVSSWGWIFSKTNNQSRLIHTYLAQFFMQPITSYTSTDNCSSQIVGYAKNSTKQRIKEEKKIVKANTFVGFPSSSNAFEAGGPRTSTSFSACLEQRFSTKT